MQGTLVKSFSLGKEVSVEQGGIPADDTLISDEK